MKKKAIAEVPYLTVRKRNKPYTAVAAVRDIDGEEHLFLEFYQRPELRIPVLRAVYTKSDWIMFKPEQGRWSSAKLRHDYYTSTLLYGGREKETAISKTSREIIEGFSGRGASRYMTWSDHIGCLEDDISFKRQRRREKRKQEGLQKRIEQMPELPVGFEGWYKGLLIKSVISYRRKGNKARFRCMECGKNWEAVTKKRDCYEGQFEHIEPVPKKGDWKICPYCGRSGLLEQEGRMKGVYGISDKCYVVQKFGKEGAVVRYFQIEKYMRLDEAAQYAATEISRWFFEPEKKRIQKDYVLYSPITGKVGWVPRNIGGFGNVSLEEGKLYPAARKELADTILKYSALQEYAGVNKVFVAGYLQAYWKHPCLEMLVKLHMTEIVERIVKDYPTEMQEDAGSPAEMLGIYKSRIRLLAKEKGNREFWNLLRLEKETGCNWKEDELRSLFIARPDIGNLRIALRYMSLCKLLNRLERYAGCSIEDADQCTMAMQGLRHVTVTYLDYIRMREVLGYDLNNFVYAYPRDLDAAHGKMVLECNEHKLDIRLREVDAKYPKIEKNYKALAKIYTYEDSGLCIRPAKSAAEIVMEGRLLHHCVGGDNYLSKHNRGDSYILMLRTQEEPDVPYITVEIRNSQILQWYGEYDKKPDRERIEAWITGYIENLNRKHLKIAV